MCWLSYSSLSTINISKHRKPSCRYITSTERNQRLKIVRGMAIDLPSFFYRQNLRTNCFQFVVMMCPSTRNVLKLVDKPNQKNKGSITSTNSSVWRAFESSTKLFLDNIVKSFHDARSTLRVLGHIMTTNWKQLVQQPFYSKIVYFLASNAIPSTLRLGRTPRTSGPEIKSKKYDGYQHKLTSDPMTKRLM
jgi:hypothetical protein